MKVIRDSQIKWKKYQECKTAYIAPPFILICENFSYITKSAIVFTLNGKRVGPGTTIIKRLLVYEISYFNGHRQLLLNANGEIEI